MKTKKTLLLACTFFVLPFITSHAIAQQSGTVPSPTVMQKVPLIGPDAYANYTFKLYNAPNNTFAYDILKNGKPVYRQFVLMYLSNEGKRFFASKPQTQKAAIVAIEKIKNGQQPTFSKEEIRKLLSL
jgi:hypothetical protein